MTITAEMQAEMQTTIHRSIQPSRTSRKARAFYDQKAGRPAIQHFDGESYSQSEHYPRIAMTKVRTHIEGGYRTGCGQTGYLGFLDGDHEQSALSMPFDGATCIKWDGYKFHTPEGVTVNSMKMAFIIGSNIVGYGINATEN